LVTDGDGPSTGMELTGASGQSYVPVLLECVVAGVTHYVGVAMLRSNGDGTSNAPAVGVGRAIASYLLRVGDAQPILAGE